MVSSSLIRGRGARFAFGLASVAALLATAGCVNLLTTAVYLIKGTNVPAEYEGLEKKRVAVLCRAPASFEYGSAPTTELAENIGTLLEQNVKKIKVVSSSEVANWTDEHGSDEDPIELGKAVKADLIVVVDLDGFSIYQSQTVFQGKTKLNINVYDCKTGKSAWSKRQPPSVFPPNSGVLTSEKEAAEFRRDFIWALANEVGRHFYAHDAYVHFAADSDYQLR